MANEARITKWYGKQVFDKATDFNIRAMHKAALLVERDVKMSFQKSATGRAYKRGDKVHRASLAGQTPAVDTGVLRASIASDVKVSMGMVTGKVGSDIGIIAAQAPAGTDVEYGVYLELGTSTMAARPFLRPALIKNRSKINDIFKAANR